jgi:hypothetical protein
MSLNRRFAIRALGVSAENLVDYNLFAIPLTESAVCSEAIDIHAIRALGVSAENLANYNTFTIPLTESTRVRVHALSKTGYQK